MDLKVKGRSWEQTLEIARQSSLILASGSPRRVKLLEQVGLDFEVTRPEIPEAAAGYAAEPAALARTRAERKARSVAREVPERIVLGADTVVALDGHILGKPLGREEAQQTLTALSGRRHRVLTGVALAVGDRVQVRLLSSASVATEVVFRESTQGEVEDYVASGEPLDKAGAYGIQGGGALLVRELHGCYFNVVGLPLSRVAEMLREVGWWRQAGVKGVGTSDVKAKC